MARNYSTAYRSTINATGAAEAPLILLEIDHPALSEPIRVVGDTLDLYSNGHRFIAMAFQIELPDDMDKQMPRARLAVDNVGRELMQWLEASNGGQGATCRIMQTLRSSADVIEFDMTLALTNVGATMTQVSADLTFDDIFNRPAVALTYRPDVAPGIF